MDEIWDLIESVSKDFPTYPFINNAIRFYLKKKLFHFRTSVFAFNAILNPADA